MRNTHTTHLKNSTWWLIKAKDRVTLASSGTRLNYTSVLRYSTSSFHNDYLTWMLHIATTRHIPLHSFNLFNFVLFFLNCINTQREK